MNRKRTVVLTVVLALLIYSGNAVLTGQENSKATVKEKTELDKKWDGLKGYVTNTGLSAKDIMENYGHLWKIEQAFRISKHDLKIRPIYHRLQRRIEAHITINFASYKIYKELERQLKQKGSELSPEKAIEIAKTIYSIKVYVPTLKESIIKTLILNDEQKYLASFFDF